MRCSIFRGPIQKECCGGTSPASWLDLAGPRGTDRHPRRLGVDAGEELR